MWNDDIQAEYENWCESQGLDPELNYWDEYDEAVAEARAEAYLDSRG